MLYCNEFPIIIPLCYFQNIHSFSNSFLFIICLFFIIPIHPITGLDDMVTTACKECKYIEDLQKNF